ncbi:MAG TPA: ThuA domain-containing protein, partial [Gemmataceae bacterium]|nr:ThuA domain-containing protein [Gemmataceae bacterium]
YPLWAKRWSKLLGMADGVTATQVRGWPTSDDFEKADIIVFYSDNPGWSADRGKELDAFLARGGGLVYIHYAVDGHNAVKEFAERIGLTWQGGKSRYRHGPQDLTFSRHPITRNLDRLKLMDESYWQLVGDPRRVHLLATGVEEKATQPLLWVREQGRSRVFVSIPGHYTWTFDDPLFRVLLLRGIAWTVHEPVDRFNELVYPGARVRD